MALIRWEPFRDVDRFFDDDFFSHFNRSLQSGMKQFGWDLAADVYEDKKGNIVAEMHLPGIDPEKLDISIEENYLHISGSREETKENKDEDKNYYAREIKRGSFERGIQLPAPVRGDKTEAYYDDGVLKVIMPKEKVEKKESRIKVRSKKSK